jgi:hypothetical protein
VQHLDAGIGQRSDQPEAVAGHVGLLGAAGPPAEARVEPLRQGQAPGRQAGVHQLAVAGEGQAVPGEVAGGEAGLDGGQLRAVQRLQGVPGDP